MTSDPPTSIKTAPSFPQLDSEPLSRCRSGVTDGSQQSPRKVERDGDEFVLDASLVGELLDVPPSDVPALMQNGRISGVCETGVDADQGTFRLNLFYLGRHARLRVDSAGHILHRSIIDFGDAPRLQRRNKTIASDR